ncbi:MAG: glycoside hydrolase family 5 protein [Turicibacter sp.]|nr:glycoside hydrolase family 5 protein [Turicibacter sp.]
MELLQVKNGKITAAGKDFWLRGVCIGGWMNMEDFINGYPGTETGIRRHIRDVLGEKVGRYFFERLLDNFFNEDDVVFLKKLGVTCVRIALNYKHFEDDLTPFEYKEDGFVRLENAIKACEKHGIYAVLEMHVVPGWQNCHWHGDNERGASLFWTHKHFQDRLSGLWCEIARRYKGRAAVAGYELMNEPCSNTPNGDHPFDFYENYRPNWEIINAVYKRLVADIRAIDSEHIIFMEGDNYGRFFDGLDAPFSENLAYSAHSYAMSGFGPNAYPGHFGADQTYWDKNRHRLEFTNHQAYIFTQKHNAPCWVSEFGSQYHGPAEQVPDRVRSMGDQLAVYNECGAHWTAWTYKDAGVMGWVTLDPESELMQIIQPIQQMKKKLGAENFVALFEPCPGREKAAELADFMMDVSHAPYNRRSNQLAFNYVALTGYAAALLQPMYAARFRNMTETDIDRLMSAYRIKNCRENAALLEVVKERLMP